MRRLSGHKFSSSISNSLNSFLRKADCILPSWAAENDRAQHLETAISTLAPQITTHDRIGQAGARGNFSENWEPGKPVLHQQVQVTQVYGYSALIRPPAVLHQRPLSIPWPNQRKGLAMALPKDFGTWDTRPWLVLIDPRPGQIISGPGSPGLAEAAARPKVDFEMSGQRFENPRPINEWGRYRSAYHRRPSCRKYCHRGRRTD
jgi:hypothetical protein